MEYLLPSTRTVEDNSSQFPSWPSRANREPGEYKASLFTFDLNLRVRL